MNLFAGGMFYNFVKVLNSQQAYFTNQNKMVMNKLFLSILSYNKIFKKILKYQCILFTLIILY